MSKIIGVTVGTTTPRPDWNQTDETKSNYIRNKPTSLGGGLTAEQLEKFNALVKWHNASTYKEMTVSIRPASSTYEIGSTANITFTYTFSENAHSVTFNGEPQPDAVKDTDVKVTVKGITTKASYIIKGTRAGGNGEDPDAKATVNFYNKYYFGYATDPGTIDSTFIMGLTSKSGFASLRPTFSSIITPDLAPDEYIWYAYPVKTVDGKAMGTSTFKANGFPGGFNSAKIVPFTNSSGYEEDYYVYRSVESGLGSGEIQIL